MTALMLDLTAFLAARLDEDERAALTENLPPRALSEARAKRAIVRRCQGRMNEPDAYPNGLVSPRALLARQVLMDLAAVWSEYPGYQPGWKP